MGDRGSSLWGTIADPRLLEGLFEHSPVAYQIYKADGHCLLVNPAFRRLFASEPSPEYCLFDDDILAKRGFLDLVRRAFAGETVEVPPHWHDPRDLERVGIAVTLFPLRGATGAVEHIALCFRNVAAELVLQQERDLLVAERRAEQALRTSEAIKADVLAVALDAIVMMDVDGKIVEFNPAAEQTFRRSRDEVVGKSLAELLVPPALRDKHRAGLQHYLATGDGPILGKRIQLTALRADGTEFPAEVAVVRTTTEGAPMFVGYIRDIAEREQASRALRESEARWRLSEERLRLAQQVASVGTFEWNIQTGVNIWTPELESMYGLAPGSFGKTQQSWEALVHPADRATAIARVEHAFETGRPVEAEWRVIWPDGSVHWLFGRFQVLNDAAGKPQRLVGVNVDITARKHADAELRRLNENLEGLVQERTAQLVAANRELEAFSYSVAHDLRAPLRGMNGFARALLDDYADRLDDEGRDHLHRIQHNAVLMGQLIDALLSLARVSRSDLQPKPTDLSALARSIAEPLLTSHPERALELVVRDGILVPADPALARTLLENLIDNAWKFTSKRPSPRIEIGAVTRESGLVVFVRDNGVGFNMAYAPKLFAPFQRLHPSREFSGTGIGLATVRRIVERHGGRVWAESKLGEGATFFFTLTPEPAR